jgi:hypothetical protein
MRCKKKRLTTLGSCAKRLTTVKLTLEQLGIMEAAKVLFCLAIEQARRHLARRKAMINAAITRRALVTPFSFGQLAAHDLLQLHFSRLLGKLSKQPGKKGVATHCDVDLLGKQRKKC